MKKIQDVQGFLSSANRSLEESITKLEGCKSIALSQLDREKTMIFSIDMNNGFAKEGALYSDRVEALIKETADFFSHCVKNNYEILAFSDSHTPNSLELVDYPQHCISGTAECELVEELSHIKPFVRGKNSTNGFFAMPEDFDYSAYENYVITGCCTDICIYQFAVSLVAYLNENGIKSRVIVPMALVETYDAPNHHADLLNVLFLESMIQNGVEVVSTIQCDERK